MRFIDRAGVRYGRLTAIRRVDADKQNSKWLCRCECGVYCQIYACHLQTGTTKSCGCGPKGRPRERHGLTNTRVYRIWRQMHQRCKNPNAEGYENYGGRGIKISPEWESFETFFADMGHPPEGTTLDRKETNGPYRADNCKWSTWKEQHRNRRDNHLLTAFGSTKCLTEWAEEYGLAVTTLKHRLYRAKMKPEDALRAPLYAQQRKSPIPRNKRSN